MSLKIPIKPLVLIGPSGSGRAAIAFRLTCDLSHKFDRVVSMTSRNPRPMEKQGFHFYFRTEQQMLFKNQHAEFITFVLSPHHHYYGTETHQLQRIMSESKIPILKVTLHSYIKNIMDEIDCYSLYINVPSMSQLQRRLRFGPFDQNEIKQKLRSAAEQQREACKYFREQDIIQNNNIEQALVKIKSRLFQLY